MKRTMGERNLDAEEIQLRGFARSLSEIDWLLLILVVLYLLASRSPATLQTPVVASLGGFVLAVLVFRFGGVLATRVRVRIMAKLLIMVAFLSAILFFTTGTDGPLVNLYLLPIVAAALTLGRFAAVMILALVVLCYFLVALAGQDVAVLGAGFVVSGVVGVLAPFALVMFSTTILAENIEAAKNRIKALSDRDELTSLYNFRAFKRLGAREHDRAARSRDRYSILMIDIDRLKVINDTYGHEAGNQAVVLVARALQRLTRSGDVVARFGGDEFVVLMAGIDQTVAENIAQRIRNVLSSTTLEVDGRMIRVGASVGVGAFPDDGDRLEAITAQADRGLYEEKSLREASSQHLVAR